MAIVDYTSLQSAIDSYLARPDLTSFIPDSISMCETDITNRLRIKEMTTSFTGTILGGQLIHPVRFLELSYAYIDKAEPVYLEPKSASWIQEKYPSNNSGEPRFIATTCSFLIFGPYPDSNYTISGYYYKKLDLASDTTNDILSEFPALYLYGSLYHISLYTRDKENGATWKGLFDENIAMARSAYELNRFGGGPLRAVSG